MLLFYSYDLKLNIIYVRLSAQDVPCNMYKQIHKFKNSCVMRSRIEKNQTKPNALSN